MNVYDFTVKDNKGNDVSLSEFRGKVLLVVNTATKCGLTPQYEGLEKLYPCNQFAFQAPGSAEKIDTFCSLKYNTKFRRFEKIKVNGKETAPFYQYLKEQKPGRIEWNFAKFLIDKNGEVAERFSPQAKPETLTGAIEKLLNA